MAALLAGQGVNEVATEYHLDPSVVSRWRKSIPADQLQQVATKKEHDFGQLVGNYLGSLLATLQVQADFFSDPEWLARQKADQLAVLHGVCADKGIRLLEAAERAAEQQSPDTDEPDAAPE
jgi:hypothetical protein